MSIREDICQIVGELPESALPPLLQHLQLLRMAETDPFARALLHAPIDDEPYTDEERAEDEEARREYLRGETRDWDDFQAELPR
jgi:hypothetical protein